MDINKLLEKGVPVLVEGMDHKVYESIDNSIKTIIISSNQGLDDYILEKSNRYDCVVLFELPRLTHRYNDDLLEKGVKLLIQSKKFNPQYLASLNEYILVLPAGDIINQHFQPVKI